MRKVRKYLHLLLSAAITLVGVSCSMDEYNEVCDYRVELRYDYNRENTTSLNVLQNYVGSISEYIFDENGVLYAENRITPDPCDGSLKSTRDLPPGRYSVISWGNLTQVCAVNDARAGITTRQLMELRIDNPCNTYAGFQNNGDRLFHAYRTFTINPTGISRIRVDMVHSHLSLRTRVRWASGATKPPVGRELQLRIESEPSQYDFMPEYVYATGSVVYHAPATHDRYNSICGDWTPHIPKVHDDKNIVRHRLNTNVDTEYEAYCEFVTFRLLNDSDALLSVYEVDGTGTVTTQIGDTKNLGDYFMGEGIELTRNLRQEFAIDIVVNADGTLSLTPLNIAEWDEGGAIGYK